MSGISDYEKNKLSWHLLGVAFLLMVIAIIIGYYFNQGLIMFIIGIIAMLCLGLSLLSRDIWSRYRGI